MFRCEISSPVPNRRRQPSNPLPALSLLLPPPQAYLMCLPLGWMGLHYFYLGRPGWGWLYLLTLGLLGWGWAWDVLRLPHIVFRSRHGFPSESGVMDLGDAYALCVGPLGLLLGVHHWALERYSWAVLHTCTFGFLGVGYVVDLFRLPCLVGEFNRRKCEQSAALARKAGLRAPSQPAQQLGDIAPDPPQPLQQV
ncbi:hypothetical protein T492DRAFT_393647 [Pavlovales sp. CCMP2436]|nr:hypothetical protein T492DRAFT_393647 [Pavlovales sp. CCMP2436]